MSNVFNILPNPLDDWLNVKDILPNDVWIKIMIEYLNYKNVIILCFTSKQFKTLYDENNVKEIIKRRGFPRLKGTCRLINIEKLLNDLKITTGHLTFKKYQKIFLNKLYDDNYDLVRGDYFYVKDKDNDLKNILNLIFDGIKLLDTHDREFYVGNNIPIDYWDKKVCGMIWLEDDKNIKNQCCNNIIKNGIEISTTFNYQNKLYKIVGYNRIMHYTISVDNFKLIFSSEDMVLLTSDWHHKHWKENRKKIRLEIDSTYYSNLLEYL
jgi:hypothetical protein